MYLHHEIDEIKSLDDLHLQWKLTFDDVVRALIAGYTFFIDHKENKSFMIKRWETRRNELLKLRDHMKIYWKHCPSEIRENLNILIKELKHQRKVFTKYAHPLIYRNFFDYALI